jgi:hypothetical protein
MHCYKNLYQYRRSAGIAGMVQSRRRCLILSVEDQDDVATTRFSDSNRTVADATSPLRLARVGPRSLTMQSSRHTAAVAVLALLTAAALGLLADRNVGTAVVLAGLAAVLGVLMVAILLADALTRPLVALADAVQALARDRSAEPNRESDIQYDNVAALQPQARRIHVVVAAPESASRTKAFGAAIVTGHPAIERFGESIEVRAVGTYIDILIPSDRRE